MTIKFLKHSISSLKLSKKSSSAIFKDSNFSSLISRYFDSDVKNNAFIDSNINSSPKSAYYDVLYELIKANKSSPIQLKAIALKFQKILSLEVEQYTIQRLLNNQAADVRKEDFYGSYNIFPPSLYCFNCNQKFHTTTTKKSLPSLALTKLPTICTIRKTDKIIDNFQNINSTNPFTATENNRSILYHPINLLIMYNGNHSANVALYENNTNIKPTLIDDISSWMNNIYFDPQSNTFNHLQCGKPISQELFHENIGYIYEISRLLYQNNIIFTINDLI